MNMGYTPVPDIDINFHCETEEELEKYKSDLLAIREKFIGQPWCESTKHELQYEMLRLESKIKYNEDYNVTASLEGEAAYKDTYWSLEELIGYYKKYYPERYEDKKEYTRLEVNNMLFELHLKGLVDGYMCVALPYSFAEKHNNKIFPDWETIGVTVKYNI